MIFGVAWPRVASAGRYIKVQVMHPFTLHRFRSWHTRGPIHWIIQPELMLDPRSITGPGAVAELPTSFTPPTCMVSRHTLNSRSGNNTPSENDDILVQFTPFPATKVSTFQFEEADQCYPGLSRMLLPGPAIWPIKRLRRRLRNRLRRKLRCRHRCRHRYGLAQVQTRVQLQAQAPANANAVAGTNVTNTNNAVPNAVATDGDVPTGVTTAAPNPPPHLPLSPPTLPPPAPTACYTCGKTHWSPCQPLDATRLH